MLVIASFASGCGQACTVAGCYERVSVALEPAVGSTYDVELVLDGVAGGFTCTEFQAGEWQSTSESGSAVVISCQAEGFDLEGAPASVEISVTAQDGSWTGSVDESPTYTTYEPNGPGCGPGCDRGELTVLKQ